MTNEVRTDDITLDSVVTRTVLVGVDGSESARHAMLVAAEEAVLRKAQLRVLLAWTPLALAPVGMPVMTDPGREAGARQVLNSEVAAVRTAHPELTVLASLVPGAAAGELVAASEHADLLVLGSKGLGGFSELLLGSVSVQAASHAQCPTLVVRPTPSDDGHIAGSEAGRIVVGVDGTSASEPALEFAIHETSMLGCGLTAIHAWETLPMEAPYGYLDAGVIEDLIDAEKTQLMERINRWTEKFPGVDVRHLVIAGPASGVLLDAARGARMLVVGSRGRGGFRRLLLGSVSHTVLHHAPCPVAIVRAQVL